MINMFRNPRPLVVFVQTTVNDGMILYDLTVNTSIYECPFSFKSLLRSNFIQKDDVIKEFMVLKFV